MPPRAVALAAIALSAVALTACASSGGLLMDGGSPDHGQSAVCGWMDLEGRTTIYGVGLENTGNASVTITNVELLETNGITTLEYALATSGVDDLGWGSADVDDIPDDLQEAWDARRDPIGAEIAAGEREYLLLVVQNDGAPEKSTGIRGVKVTYDGAPWPRSTENRNVYGFGPEEAECDAGLGPTE